MSWYLFLIILNFAQNHFFLLNAMIKPISYARHAKYSYPPPASLFFYSSLLFTIRMGNNSYILWGDYYMTRWICIVYVCIIRNKYMIDVIQLPDMRIIPFSITDSPMMHTVGTTVSGVMYFNVLPTSPVKNIIEKKIKK